MFLRLLFFMTIIPIVEISLILRFHEFFASHWGSNQAILISIGSIILTGVLGARLMKSQGFQLMTRIQTQLQAGQIPQNEVLEGVMVLIGGVLLLTPGYATDLFGLLLLAPVSRSIFRNSLKRFLERQAQSGHIHVHYRSSGPKSSPFQEGFRQAQPRPEFRDPQVIDAEFHDEK